MDFILQAFSASSAWLLPFQIALWGTLGFVALPVVASLLKILFTFRQQKTIMITESAVLGSGLVNAIYTAGLTTFTLVSGLLRLIMKVFKKLFGYYGLEIVWSLAIGVIVYIMFNVYPKQLWMTISFFYEVFFLPVREYILLPVLSILKIAFSWFFVGTGIVHRVQRVIVNSFGADVLLCSQDVVGDITGNITQATIDGILNLNEFLVSGDPYFNYSYYSLGYAIAVGVNSFDRVMVCMCADIGITISAVVYLDPDASGRFVDAFLHILQSGLMKLYLESSDAQTLYVAGVFPYIDDLIVASFDLFERWLNQVVTYLKYFYSSEVMVLFVAPPEVYSARSIDLESTLFQPKQPSSESRAVLTTCANYELTVSGITYTVYTDIHNCYPFCTALNATGHCISCDSTIVGNHPILYYDGVDWTYNVTFFIAGLCNGECLEIPPEDARPVCSNCPCIAIDGCDPWKCLTCADGYTGENCTSCTDGYISCLSPDFASVNDGGMNCSGDQYLNEPFDEITQYGSTIFTDKCVSNSSCVPSSDPYKRCAACTGRCWCIEDHLLGVSGNCDQCNETVTVKCGGECLIPCDPTNTTLYGDHCSSCDTCATNPACLSCDDGYVLVGKPTGTHCYINTSSCSDVFDNCTTCTPSFSTCTACTSTYELACSGKVCYRPQQCIDNTGSEICTNCNGTWAPGACPDGFVVCNLVKGGSFVYADLYDDPGHLTACVLSAQCNEIYVPPVQINATYYELSFNFPSMCLPKATFVTLSRLTNFTINWLTTSYGMYNGTNGTKAFEYWHASPVFDSARDFFVCIDTMGQTFDNYFLTNLSNTISKFGVSTVSLAEMFYRLAVHHITYWKDYQNPDGSYTFYDPNRCPTCPNPVASGLTITPAQVFWDNEEYTRFITDSDDFFYALSNLSYAMEVPGFDQYVQSEFLPQHVSAMFPNVKSVRDLAVIALNLFSNSPRIPVGWAITNIDAQPTIDSIASFFHGTVNLLATLLGGCGRHEPSIMYTILGDITSIDPTAFEVKSSLPCGVLDSVDGGIDIVSFGAQDVYDTVMNSLSFLVFTIGSSTSYSIPIPDFTKYTAPLRVMTDGIGRSLGLVDTEFVIDATEKQMTECIVYYEDSRGTRTKNMYTLAKEAWQEWLALAPVGYNGVVTMAQSLSGGEDAFVISTSQFTVDILQQVSLAMENMGHYANCKNVINYNTAHATHLTVTSQCTTDSVTATGCSMITIARILRLFDKPISESMADVYVAVYKLIGTIFSIDFKHGFGAAASAFASAVLDVITAIYYVVADMVLELVFYALPFLRDFIYGVAFEACRIADIVSQVYFYATRWICQQLSFIPLLGITRPACETAMGTSTVRITCCVNPATGEKYPAGCHTARGFETRMPVYKRSDNPALEYLNSVAYTLRQDALFAQAVYAFATGNYSGGILNWDDDSHCSMKMREYARIWEETVPFGGSPMYNASTLDVIDYLKCTSAKTLAVRLWAWDNRLADKEYGLPHNTFHSWTTFKDVMFGVGSGMLDLTSSYFLLPGRVWLPGTEASAYLIERGNKYANVVAVIWERIGEMFTNTLFASMFGSDPMEIFSLNGTSTRSARDVTVGGGIIQPVDVQTNTSSNSYSVLGSKSYYFYNTKVPSWAIRLVALRKDMMHVAVRENLAGQISRWWNYVPPPRQNVRSRTIEIAPSVGQNPIPKQTATAPLGYGLSPFSERAYVQSPIERERYERVIALRNGRGKNGHVRNVLRETTRVGRATMPWRDGMKTCAASAAWLTGFDCNILSYITCGIEPELANVGIYIGSTQQETIKSAFEVISPASATKIHPNTNPVYFSAKEFTFPQPSVTYETFKEIIKSRIDITLPTNMTAAIEAFPAYGRLLIATADFLLTTSVANKSDSFYSFLTNFDTDSPVIGNEGAGVGRLLVDLMQCRPMWDYVSQPGVLASWLWTIIAAVILIFFFLGRRLSAMTLIMLSAGASGIMFLLAMYLTTGSSPICFLILVWPPSSVNDLYDVATEYVLPPHLPTPDGFLYNYQSLSPSMYTGTDAEVRVLVSEWSSIYNAAEEIRPAFPGGVYNCSQDLFPDITYTVVWWINTFSRNLYDLWDSYNGFPLNLFYGSPPPQFKYTTAYSASSLDIFCAIQETIPIVIIWNVVVLIIVFAVFIAFEGALIYGGLVFFWIKCVQLATGILFS